METKEYIIDVAAILVLGVGGYIAIMGSTMPDFFNVAFGAAMTYLFIKNSPNTTP